MTGVEMGVLYVLLVALLGGGVVWLYERWSERVLARAVREAAGAVVEIDRSTQARTSNQEFLDDVRSGFARESTRARVEAAERRGDRELRRRLEQDAPDAARRGRDRREAAALRRQRDWWFTAGMTDGEIRRAAMARVHTVESDRKLHTKAREIAEAAGVSGRLLDMSALTGAEALSMVRKALWIAATLRAKDKCRAYFGRLRAMGVALTFSPPVSCRFKGRLGVAHAEYEMRSYSGVRR